jgi:hypothetical protein
MLEAYHGAYPALTRLDTIGSSIHGHPLVVMEITNRATGPAEEKPALYLDGSIHAQELTASEVVLYVMDHLLRGVRHRPAGHRAARHPGLLPASQGEPGGIRPGAPPGPVDAEHASPRGREWRRDPRLRPAHGPGRRRPHPPDAHPRPRGRPGGRRRRSPHPAPRREGDTGPFYRVSARGSTETATAGSLPTGSAEAT